MKNTIFKSLVALMLIAAIPACTDEVPVDVNPSGTVTIRPDGTHITTLKNILPDTKPGYQGVDGRAYNNEVDTWCEGDELLLKLEIKGTENYPVYTAYMKLEYGDDSKWSIVDDQYFASCQSSEESSVTYDSGLSLVTPTTGIVLNGDGVNFDAIIPEEIQDAALHVELMYAPDLKWTNDESTIKLVLEENPSSPTPEVWEVKAVAQSSVVSGGTAASSDSYVWDTNLARVCVNTGFAGDVVTLSSTSFAPYNDFKNTTDGTYTATARTDGIAYFYGTIGSTGSPVSEDFQINLNKVMIDTDDEEATEVFVPTTLFKASTLNKVTLSPAVSYLLDGTDSRTQALNDSKGAEISDDGKIYTVYGVKGLLQWVADLNNADGVINFSMNLKNDIVLPQFEIKKRGDNSNLEYYYDYEIPIAYDENGMPTNSNWIGVNKGTSDNGDFGLSGTVDGNNKVISGLRINSSTGFVYMLQSDGTIKNLNFDDVIVNSSDNAAVIVTTNEGKVEGCIVANSLVSGAGDMGAVVATNKGTVSDCHNVSTDVIGQKATSRTSELVGGVVGHNVGDKSIVENRNQGVVTNCTNSGRVISNGTCGNNFTGGVVGHSYGIVSYCTNTGYVESSTDCSGNNKIGENGVLTADQNQGYHTSVGGVVGNCSFGSVIACMNEGKVESKTNDIDKGYNRVGGVIGYAGTNSVVVACGNVGDIAYASAKFNHVGGIVGYLYHSYGNSDKADYVEDSVPGELYGSWTKTTKEMSGTTNVGDGDKDGVGSIYLDQTDLVNCSKVFAKVGVVKDTDIGEMNTAINSYNSKYSSNPNCSCSKTWTSGSWPTLGTSTNP